MDNVFKSDIHYQDHTDELTHKVTQPSEDIILNRNQELRKNAGVIQDLGAQSKGEGGTWGRQVASVPLIMFEEAIRNGFDLNSKDSEHAGREMMRFLQSEKGKICLVTGRL